MKKTIREIATEANIYLTEDSHLEKFIQLYAKYNFQKLDDNEIAILIYKNSPSNQPYKWVKAIEEELRIKWLKY